MLFVSHNMDSIKNLCKSGILLDKGRTVFMGTAVDCINQYLDNNRDVFLLDTTITEKHRKFLRYKQIEILSVKLLNETPHLAMDEDVVAEVTMRRNEQKVEEFTMEMMVEDVMGRRVGSYISPVIKVEKESFKCIVRLKNHNLAKGKYYLNFNVGMKKNDESLFLDYDIVFGVLSFEIAYLSVEKKDPIKLWRGDWGLCQFRDGETYVL